LSITYRHCFSGSVQCKKRGECYRLKRFVREQKNLDEFGMYMGAQRRTEWMDNILKYVEKTVKTLTIENMLVENIFKKYKFTKLETLRFEYMLFRGYEESLEFSILERSLKDILSLPSLKALVFSQYQRRRLKEYQNQEEKTVIFSHYRPYNIVEDRQQEEKFKNLDKESEQISPEPNEKLEILIGFWGRLKAELENHKDKPLRIKYHKKDDYNVSEKVRQFKEIFRGLPACQSFEYEVARISKLSDKEVKAKGLEVEHWNYGLRNFNHYWIGVRYVISLNRIEQFKITDFPYETVLVQSQESTPYIQTLFSKSTYPKFFKSN